MARRPEALDQSASTAADAPLSVHLLGPIEVTRQGEPVRLAGVACRLILAELALSPGRYASDQRLTELLWANGSPPSDSALRVAITRLRRQLPTTNESVRRDGRGYRLISALVVDVDRLAALEDSVFRLAQSDTDQLSSCREALGLWRGQSVADVRILDGGAPVANQLDLRRAAMRRRLAEVASTTDQLVSCLSEFQAWFDSEPLDEMAACSLARALGASGRVATALRVMHQADRALIDVGLSPTKEFRACQAELVLLSPLERPGPVTVALPRAVHDRMVPTLYGRDADLAFLTERWDLAQGALTIRISGQSGIGKSSLAARFVSDQAADGVAIAWVEVDPDIVRAGAVIDAVRSQLAPELATAGPPCSIPNEDDRSIHRAAVEGGLALLLQCISAGPTIIVVDDAHWLDELSAEILQRFARRPHPEKVLLVLIERSGDRPRVDTPQILGRELQALGRTDLSQWLGDDSLLDLDEVVAATGGVPILVSQCVRSGGTDAARQAGASLFNEQTSGLHDDSVEIVSAAAVLGRSFDFAELVRLVDRSELDVLEAIDGAIRSRLIVDTGSPMLHFSHDTIVLAAQQRWSQVRVAKMHARALSVVPLGDAARRFRHAVAGGEFIERPAFVVAALRAGEALIAANGFADARAALGACIAYLDDDTVSLSISSRVLALLAQCEGVLGDVASARLRLAESAKRAAACGDAESRALSFASRSVLGHRWPGEVGALTANIDVLDHLEQLPTGLRARFARQLFLECVYAGDTAAANEVRHRVALAVERNSNDASLAVVLTAFDHQIARLSGDRAARAEALVRAERRYRDGGDAFIAPMLSEQLHLGNLDEAHAWATELRDIGRRTYDSYREWLGLTCMFTVPFVRGDCLTATANADEAARFGTDHALDGTLTANAAQRFALAWVHGDVGPFIPLLQAAVGGTDSTAWNATLALALALQGAHDEARKLLDAAVDTFDELNEHWLAPVSTALNIEASWLIGHRGFASRALPAIAHRTGDHILLGLGALDLGPAARYQALCTAVLGDVEQAAADLAELACNRSATIWTMRAGIDRSTLRGEPAAVDLTGPWARYIEHSVRIRLGE